MSLFTSTERTEDAVFWKFERLRVLGVQVSGGADANCLACRERIS
jgi:hypothetical protein